tara:strand:+ start:4031 stop:4963 length:933 start_codon:yes stop_codon:yes gene_type:complete
MALIDIVNSVMCGAGDVLGTGTKNCKQDIKRVTTLALIERGYTFADGDIDTLAGVRLLQQKGKAIILNGVVEIADNTAEDNIITRTGSGEKIVAGKNPYEYTVTFDNGLAYHKALTTLSSYRGYDIVFFDSKGDVFFTQTKAGLYKGFTLGMFENGKYMMSNGADAASQSVTFQMINRLEFDERVSWIVSDNLDYNAQEDLDGYNDASITLTAPADTDTSVSFSIKTVADNHLVSISGLLVSDLVYTVNGATVVPSAITEVSAGNYTLTVAAVSAADVITLALYDGAANSYIADVDGILYKSNIASTVVV